MSNNEGYLANSQPQYNDCPFDTIRNFHTDGSEYWVARELMEWLGYARWENFLKAVHRSQKSLINQGIDIEKHFRDATKKTKGRDLLDFNLSRLACYTISMNSDPEKDMVAQAQGYFAVQTRDAETGGFRKLTRRQLAEMIIEEADRAEKAEAEALALAAKIEADEPATTLGRVIEASESHNIRIGDFAKVLGDVGQNKYFDELRECKILMMGGRLPYQQYISAGYFRVTQVQGTGNAANKWFPVTLITPKGQTYLAKRHKQYLASIATERIIEAQVEALV